MLTEAQTSWLESWMPRGQTHCGGWTWPRRYDETLDPKRLQSCPIAPHSNRIKKPKMTWQETRDFLASRTPRPGPKPASCF